MSRSSEFDRAVGFFRSTVFVVAWPALKRFARNRGRIRVLCSHVMAPQDIEAIGEGYEARVNEELSRHFVEEVRSLLREPELHRPATILAALVSERIVEVKIAMLTPDDRKTVRGRVFHDKLGIFRDDAGNTVIFKGSMNETWTGLAADGNLESVDVAASWLGKRDQVRVTEEVGYFEDLWRNRYPGLSVRPFPDVALEELQQAAAPDWRHELDDGLEAQQRAAPGSDPRGRSLRPHQAAGLASWQSNGRRGILEFATGSGKTFTAITALRESLRCGERALVVVPDRVLFAQWYDELRETTTDLDARILLAGAGHSDWRPRLRSWLGAGSQPRLVLATLRTASASDFLERIPKGQPTTLIVDEVHRTGSRIQRKLLDADRFPGARLGLSATPERAGDAEGTAVILGFFEAILEPRYSLADAVGDGVLCPYFYSPHTVALTEDEQERWGELTVKIRLLYGLRSSGDATVDLEERIRLLLIERARVVKRAENKVQLAVEVLSQHLEPGQGWLVYCDDMTQLDVVRTALDDAGIDTLPFHSRMHGDRDATLRWLLMSAAASLSRSSA